MMNTTDVRLGLNPILTALLLGMGQGTYIAQSLFPRLPQSLANVQLAKMGNERFKRYNLRRAPGSLTKRVDVKYEGKVYGITQQSVEVPLPREIIRESDAMRAMNIGDNLDVSKVAMTTANDILALDYETEVAAIATDPTQYASGHAQALSAGTKWSSSTGTPVTDIRAASDVIRKKIGKRPNTLVLSADAFFAITTNAQVKGYLPVTNLGPANVEQLKTILNVENIVIGDAVWMDANDVGQDVWGNNAILAYVPKIGAGNGDISLAEPGFGFTNVIQGSPFAEPPYYDNATKSWIFGATYERRPNVAYNTAAMLFTNVR